MSTQTLSIGDPPIRIALRRNKRARRLTLRVSHSGDQVSITLPSRVPLAEAARFAEAREDWIREKLGAFPPVVCPEPGIMIPVDGQERLLARGTGRTAKLLGVRLEVPGEGQVFRNRLKQFLRLRARAVLAAACDRYAAETDRRYTRLTLRDTRSRWGSCTSTGGLMFSWRLIMAPAEVLDYVAAHEVAHLTHMHHGPDFWALVEALKPGYRTHQNWLRQHGATLHRFQFEDQLGALK